MSHADPGKPLSKMQRAVYEWIGQNGKGRPKQIADALGYPRPSVRRVLQELKDKGLVQSRKGTYELAESSDLEAPVTTSNEPRSIDSLGPQTGAETAPNPAATDAQSSHSTHNVPQSRRSEDIQQNTPRGGEGKRQETMSEGALTSDEDQGDHSSAPQGLGGHIAVAAGKSDTKSESLLRNHCFDKHRFDETVVSSNGLAKSVLPQASAGGRAWVRSYLRLTDDWHSTYASVQDMFTYLRLRKSGSLMSAKSHSQVLASFSRRCGIDPDKLVKLPRDRIETLVQEHCDRLMEISRLRGRSAMYANAALTCLKTFFACSGFNRENGLELRVKRYHQPPRTTNRPEYIPLLKESRIMAERSGGKRDRATILTVATTGLRNSAVRALRVGDILTELKAGEEILLINVKPDWNERIPGACKNCIPYYTFTAKIATEAIRSMLTEREARFGSLLPEEPLFISNYNQIKPDQRRMKPLTTRELEIIVKKAAKAGDIAEWNSVHVHSMRKVFESVLRSPLTDGSQMDPQDQVFLMGHIQRGSQENYYDRTKIEKMRELYSKLAFEDKPPVEEQSLQIWRKIAKIHGVDSLEAKASKEKELGRSLSYQEEEELLEELLKQQIKRGGCGQDREEQKIVNLGDLEEHIKSGWLFVSTLPNNKAVIKTLQHRKP